MKVYYRLSIVIGISLLLTGCLGEKYDFTPPVVSLMNNTDYLEEELVATNIEWDSDKLYTKKTDDIFSVANEQQKIHYDPGQEVTITFVNQDFAVKELRVYVSQDDVQTDLPVDGMAFNMPEEKGDYSIVVSLLADSGTAEYVGNIVVK